MNLSSLLEAILFSSDEPVPLTKLIMALETTEERVMEAVSSLERDYADRGVMLKRVSGGFMFVTRPEYAAEIEKALSKKVPMSLSKGSMETLAIVAYKQPVTRQDIEASRGVNPEASIETLLEKGLIREVGRKKTLGRPKLYGTTDEFLRKSGLNSISDLPRLIDDESDGEVKLVPDPQG